MMGEKEKEQKRKKDREIREYIQKLTFKGKRGRIEGER